MSAIAFDTLKLARSLREKAQLSSDQAEGFDDAISEALQGGVATRTDLRETELRLEAKIEASKAEILKWMFGTIGLQTIVILGAVIALARLIRP